jgi:hypothetical protein
MRNSLLISKKEHFFYDFHETQKNRCYTMWYWFMQRGAAHIFFTGRVVCHEKSIVILYCSGNGRHVAGCDAVAEFLGVGEKVGEEGLEGENENSPEGDRTDEDENLSAESDSPCFYVSVGGNDTGNDGPTSAMPFLTLAKAYAAALGDPTHKRIVVLSDLSESGLVTLDPSTVSSVSESKNILIEGTVGGTKPEIKRSQAVNDSVLAITGGAHITFKNIMINGKVVPDNDGANRALHISGAGTEVTLESQTVITGKKRAMIPMWIKPEAA